MKKIERITNYDNRGRSALRIYPGIHETTETTNKDCSVEESEILTTLGEYRRSTDSKNSSTTQYFDAWKEIVECLGPFSHMFTIAFKQPYSDVEAINAIRGWCSIMNRSIKGPRWKKNENGIEGIVAAERHRISMEFRHRLHFHVLIKSYDGLPDTDELRTVALRCALRLVDQTKRNMTDIDRVDLTEIDDQQWLTGYFIKDIFSPDWQVGDNLAFWSRDSGLGPFRFTPKAPNELRKRH